MELNGYGQAVIHLAWIRDDEIQHLLFGMVELRPTELPCDPGCSMKSVRSGNKDRKYLYYQRFAASVAVATAWYQRAIGNDLALPDNDAASLQGGPFVQEPPWPAVVTSNDLRFAPDWMHGSQAHFLFPKNVLSPEVGEIIETDKIRKKLLEWLNFDIVDMYPEYRGAISLVAPNPLFRSIEKTPLKPPRPGFAESVAYKIVARQRQDLHGLRLEIVNERPRGRLVPLVHDFSDDPIVVFDFSVRNLQRGDVDHAPRPRIAQLARASSNPEKDTHQNGTVSAQKACARPRPRP